MSLVIHVMDNKMSIICGDTQLNLPDGSKGIIRKVFKINNTIICGGGGDAAAFYGILLFAIDSAQKVITNNFSFEEFVYIIEQRFLYYTSLEENSNKHVTIIVSGIYNNTLTTKIFSKIGTNIVNSPLYQYGDNKKQIRFVASENTNTSMYQQFLKEKFDEIEFTLDNAAIIFQKLLDTYADDDDSINKFMHVVYLQKDEDG